MDIKIKRAKNKTCHITLDGALSIKNVGELKGLLLEEATKQSSITLDISRVTDVDVAGMQLLCATHKFMKSSGREILLQGSPDTFGDFIARSGFRHHKGCSEEFKPCLWSEGNGE